ncbi:acetyltransferase [Streptomyces sviceus ATCC 29083]|uniref:Acetyltransferase n=1 Tax=Streptomyces sviceus (strain ATCC 29083 / DSM 924 / JCM 4929 / NBRC 13980 / NCIMB 11184 / NRRL 5439 / UC 5370) TaxID=463191 RepID=B5I0C6_STRX2|nr:acetyltransferase [Streptomyces sviceus ATCC 29083]
MDDPLLIREMTLADCDRVAEIRIRGWQSAYRGLMPQPFLDALSVREDAERRRARFGQGGAAVVDLVAERDGEILGWACHGPYRDGDIRTEDAELYAIYVDPRRYGSGLGHALLQESVRRCATAGRRCRGPLRRGRRPRARGAVPEGPVPVTPHLCRGIRASARTAASASDGCARASCSTGLARASASVPSPSTQASATRR